MKILLKLFAVIFLLTACNGDNPKQKGVNTILKLGYCPTMQNDAQNLLKQNANIELVTFRSAREVLVDLRTGKIDLALIGRKAEKTEIGENILEKKLFEAAFTLINSQKSFITENELANLKVKSCLDKNLVKNEFSELKNITFVEKSNCKINNQEVWLVAWDDWKDSMELLIPVDRGGNKIKKYRGVFLYGEELKELEIFRK